MATIGSLAVNIIARTQQFNTGVAKVRGDIRGLQTVAAGSGNALGGFANKLLTIATAATIAVTALTAVIRVNENFNQALTQSTAIMADATDDVRARMAKTAIDVASTTTASAAEAGRAYFYLASAGLNAEQSIAAMPQVAKFAQAGMFDLSLATDLATDAQSALGLTVKDTQQNLTNLTLVTDTLVKANTLANANVEQFSRALTTKAGAAMKILGMNIAEGVAVLAAFADQGIKGEEAGTAFNIVIRDLTTKAIENAAAFRKAGIAVFDQAGELRNMSSIIADVENKLAGLSDEQAKATLLQLGFADKSIIFIQSLIGMSGKIHEYEMALRQAGGTTAAVADRNMTPLQKAWARMSSSLTALITTFSPFVDGLASIIALVGAFVEQVVQWISVNQSVASSIVNIKLVGFIAGLVGVTVIVPLIVSGVLAIAKALYVWAAAKAAVLALEGPWGWAILVAGLAAGTASAYLLSKQYEELSAKVELTNGTTTQAVEINERLKNTKAGVLSALQDETSITGDLNKVTEARNKLMERGKQLTEQLRTPLEIYKDSLVEAINLYRAEAISLEIRNRAIDDAREKYEDATRARKEFESGGRNVSAAVAGTTAGFEAVHASQQEMKRLADLQQQQVAEQQQANDILNDIRNNTAEPVNVNQVNF